MDVDLDVAPYHQHHALRLRQEELAALWEPAAPRHTPVGDPATRVGSLPELHSLAFDAHRAAGNRDIRHLHGAVAEEQLRRIALLLPAGEVEAAGGVVAAGLHAERVGDADVAATAGAAATGGAGCYRRRRGNDNPRQDERDDEQAHCGSHALKNALVSLYFLSQALLVSLVRMAWHIYTW